MTNRVDPLIRYLRKALRPVDADADLLGRFISTRDEAAFEALVRRHGHMVLSVCRRVLGNSHDAEDAFQATFLILVRKASTVVPREAVGNWLYGVAYRTALHARRRRPNNKQQVQDMTQAVAATDDEWRSLVPFLDQELVRLPDKYRLPVVLCELEGRSRKEVARQLGVPEGTLSSRLATARKLLAKRLARYGEFSGAGLAAVLSQSAEASLPAGLTSSTVKAALAAGSATVAALADGVLKAMFITKLKTVSWAVVVAVSVSVGAVGLTSAQQKAPTPNPAAAEPRNRPQTVTDELEVLRLEIEALRKDLKITKDRVQALETELKGQSKGVPRALSSPVRGNQIRKWDATTGKLYTVYREKEGGLTITTEEPFANAESALKRLREHPHDKISLRAVEQAVSALKTVSDLKDEPEVSLKFLRAVTGDVKGQPVAPAPSKKSD